MNGNYQIGEAVLGNWVIRRKLGEGSFGKVWEIEREDFGQRYKAALKIITVPQSEAELRGVLEEGMDQQGAEKYFYTVVEDIVREFALMARLKGTAHVVSYEDHTVLRHQNGIGWDILIRMELLTPLLAHAYAHPFTRRDIIRLGIDMCLALELCQKYNIIHRDIKPENIFVSETGDFKLGDFGIARTVEKTMSGLSKKGTYNYMAPEVYRGSEYGFSVDTYSLGIVLYRMLNRNRVPFMPSAPEPITFSSREIALAKRMGGEIAPPPFHAEGRLAEIIAKAIAYQPKERYSSPMQMRQELESILYDKEDAEAIYPDGDELALAENIYVSQTPEGSSPAADFEASAATQSLFGAAHGAAASDRTDGTQSMFGQNAAAAQADGTSGTQSIFGRQSTPKETAAKTLRDRPKGKLKGWHKAVLALAGVGIAAGIIITVNLKQAQQQEQRAAQYRSLMSSASSLYESDPQQAAALLLQAGELSPDSPDPFIGYTYALYLAGEYDACIDYVENDLSLGKGYDISGQSQLSEILGAAYFEKRDYAASASFFRLSTAGGDITVPAMRDYAVALGKLGDIEAAGEVLQKMFAAGADEIVTRYVQAEVDFAQQDYLKAEQGFRTVLAAADADDDLCRRAMRSLAEVYRDCAALEKLGTSPIAGAAQREAELLAEGIVRYGLGHDSTLWEMLAQAYYDAYHMNPSLGEDWLEKASAAFRQVIDLGIRKEYLYSNLFTIDYELGDYTAAGETLEKMKELYPRSYTPHALRCMLLITVESGKPETGRDYTAAYQEYQEAQGLLSGSDDRTYFQQVESLIGELEAQGWLS